MKSILVLFFALLVFLDNSQGAYSQDAAVREWTDASGSFKVQASLVQQTRSTVTLKKLDGTTIKVPVGKLSEGDRQYLAGLGESELPSFEVLKDLSCEDRKPLLFGNQVSLGTEPLSAIIADGQAAKSVLSYKPFQVVAGEVDPYDQLSKPIVINREEGVFAMSIGRHMAGQPQSKRGRIGRFRYGSSQAELLIDAPETLDILDHHEESGFSLAVAGKDELYRGGELLLIKGLGEGPRVQVVLRRLLPGIDKPGFKPDVTWATLLDSDLTVLQIDNVVSAFNLVTGESLYHIKDIYPGAISAISPGGNYLAIPTIGEVILVDSRSGETLGRIKIDSLLCPVVKFDPTGSFLAIGYDTTISIWSLPEGRMIREIVSTNPLGNVCGWVGPNLILTSLAGLVDTELEMSVWRYSFPNHRLAVLQGGMLLADSADSVLVMRTLPIPHPGMEKIQKLLGRPGSMVVEPGSPVAIRVESTVDVSQSLIHEGVEQAIARTGWRVDPTAKVQLVVVIGKGEESRLQISETGNSSSRTERKTFVTVTPFSVRVELRSEGSVMWSRDINNPVPTSVTLAAGQSPEEVVAQLQKPSGEFFSRLSFPSRIAKPEARKSTWGSSRLSAGNWIDD